LSANAKKKIYFVKIIKVIKPEENSQYPSKQSYFCHIFLDLNSRWYCCVIGGCVEARACLRIVKDL
jgi:hypothetical protein